MIYQKYNRGVVKVFEKWDRFMYSLLQLILA